MTSPDRPPHEESSALTGGIAGPITPAAPRPAQPQAPADRQADPFAEAVAMLPALPADAPDDRYGVRALTAAWLRKLKSDATRRAYFRDLAAWLDYCHRTRLDPLAARRADVDDWSATMTVSTRSGGTRPPGLSTRARRLAAISSWYTYLQSNEVAERNPMRLVERPSSTEIAAAARRAPTLSPAETALLLDTSETRAARLDTEAAWRDAAVVALLFYTALRVSAITGADVADLDTEAGYRILRHRLKGKGPDGRDYVRVDGELCRVLDTYLAVRARRSSEVPLAGPLLVTTPHPYDPTKPGGKRLTQRDVTNILRRQAELAGLPAAARLTPHSGRRTVITTLLGNDVPLSKVQDLAGHADPRTTRRYDDTNHKLAASPVTDLTRILARHRASPDRPGPDSERR